jgi:hypothetical protein
MTSVQSTMFPAVRRRNQLRLTDRNSFPRRTTRVTGCSGIVLVRDHIIPLEAITHIHRPVFHGRIAHQSSVVERDRLVFIVIVISTERKHILVAL